MPGKPKYFTADARNNVASLLASLPEKQSTERGLATRELIASLKADVIAAQKKGYTIEEIVQSFKEGGVDIGLTTLKSSMKKSTRKRQPKAETRGVVAVDETQPIEVLEGGPFSALRDR